MISDKQAAELREEVRRLNEEVDSYRQWIDDLQSGMYINCVYCGHRYGPDDEVPASMADVLKEHVEQCPKHPMSKLKKALEKIATDPCIIPTAGLEMRQQAIDALKELGEDNGGNTNQD